MSKNKVTASHNYAHQPRIQKVCAFEWTWCKLLTANSASLATIFQSLTMDNTGVEINIFVLQTSLQ